MSDTNPGRKKTWPFVRYCYRAEGFDVSLEEQSQLPGLVVIMTVSNNNVTFLWSVEVRTPAVWTCAEFPTRLESFWLELPNWDAQKGNLSDEIYLDASSVEKNKPFQGALSCLIFEDLLSASVVNNRLQTIFLLLLLDSVPDMSSSSSLDSVTFGPV